MMWYVVGALIFYWIGFGILLAAEFLWNNVLGFKSNWSGYFWGSVLGIAFMIFLAFGVNWGLPASQDFNQYIVLSWLVTSGIGWLTVIFKTLFCYE